MRAWAHTLTPNSYHKRIHVAVVLLLFFVLIHSSLYSALYCVLYFIQLLCRYIRPTENVLYIGPNGALKRKKNEWRKNLNGYCSILLPYWLQWDWLWSVGIDIGRRKTPVMLQLLLRWGFFFLSFFFVCSLDSSKSQWTTKSLVIDLFFL